MAKRQTSGSVIFTDDFHQARTSPDIIGPVWCAKHHFSGPWPCSCPPGPSVRALRSIADEILYGGARGGMKSETGLLFMIGGNHPSRWSGPLDLSGHRTPTPIDISYINCPRYRGLFLRESVVDMEDFLDRAERMYKRGGAEFHYDSPITIQWPNGAKFIVSYLSDERNTGKVLGPEYHRVVWEQLEQIKREDVYKKLFGSMRSTIPGIYRQLMANANPGSGPGQTWIMNRWIDLIGPDGKVIKPDTVWTNPETGRTRVFIPARVVDNPYLIKCPECDQPNCEIAGHPMPPYLADLMEQPEHLRRAWIEGDWKTLAGGYFPEFREHKVAGEPENALHCIPREKMPLRPWWPTWLSMDWGRTHPCCTLWFKENPETHQIMVYREFVTAQSTANEIGAAVAVRCIEDFKGMEQKILVMSLSPDAFAHKESPNSLADQIRDGIDEVLGPKSAFVMDFTEDEKKLEYDEAYKSMLRRRDEIRGECRILIVKAHDKRIDGWERLRDLFRWRPLQEQNSSAFSLEIAKNLLELQGTLKYLEYMRQFETLVRVLPGIQIASELKFLIRSIQTLIFAKGDRAGTGDAEKMDGDDPAETLRYGVMAYEPRKAKMPEGEYVQKAITGLVASTGYLSTTSLVHASMKAHADYAKLNPKPRGITPSRRAGKQAMSKRTM